MNYSEDHIALAAEYALGTLDADERALVETMMIVDNGFRDVVEAWDRKLSPLHQMVGPIEPPDHVWERIKAEAGLTGNQAPMASMPTFVEPFAPLAHQDDDEDERHIRDIQRDNQVRDVQARNAPPPEPPPPAAELRSPDITPRDEIVPRDEISQYDAIIPRDEIAPPDDVKTPAQSDADIERELFGDEPYIPPEIVAAPVASSTAEASSNVVQLPRRTGRGGVVYGALMTAVAASLAAVVALQAYRPDVLPDQLRIKPKIERVEIRTPAPPAGAQFVALLQQDVSLPAFILTVDTATKNFTVRKVGAVPEPGKSYELWLVSDKLQRPRSLGVIGGSDFTIRPALSAYDNETINKATYAVTVEPEGGSPTGAPTSTPIFTGKLVESVPELPPR